MNITKIYLENKQKYKLISHYIAMENNMILTILNDFNAKQLFDDVDKFLNNVENIIQKERSSSWTLSNKLLAKYVSDHHDILSDFKKIYQKLMIFPYESFEFSEINTKLQLMVLMILTNYKL